MHIAAMHNQLRNLYLLPNSLISVLLILLRTSLSKECLLPLYPMIFSTLWFPWILECFKWFLENCYKWPNGNSTGFCSENTWELADFYIFLERNQDWTLNHIINHCYFIFMHYDRFWLHALIAQLMLNILSLIIYIYVYYRC